MGVLGKIGASLLVIIMFALFVVASISPTLFMLFLILKLCAVITFSWFWVCFPLIISFVFWSIWIILAVFLGED